MNSVLPVKYRLAFFSELTLGVSQDIKSFLTEAINQSVITVTETAKQSKDSLKETALQATGAVKETTSESISAVVGTSEKAKNTLTEVTRQAVDQVTQVTDRASSSVAATAEQAKSSINEMVQRTDDLTSSIADAIQTELSSTIQNWGAEHPVIYWTIYHPLQALALFLFIIFIFQNLFKLINRLIIVAWLAVLKLPFNISYYLFKVLKNNANKERFSDVEETVSLVSSAQQIQLSEILQRLETINQEQNQLLQQIIKILGSNK